MGVPMIFFNYPCAIWNSQYKCSPQIRPFF